MFVHSERGMTGWIVQTFTENVLWKKKIPRLKEVCCLELDCHSFLRCYKRLLANSRSHKCKLPGKKLQKLREDGHEGEIACRTPTDYLFIPLFQGLFESPLYVSECSSSTPEKEKINRVNFSNHLYPQIIINYQHKTLMRHCSFFFFPFFFLWY